jgi:hypothetical protein
MRRKPVRQSPPTPPRRARHVHARQTKYPCDWKLGFGVQKGGLRAVRLRSARVSVSNINHKGASGSAVRPLAKSRAGREREARPCGVPVRGCFPRASLRQIPKEVVDCLKVVVLFTFTERGSSRKLYRLAARHRARQLIV